MGNYDTSLGYESGGGSSEKTHVWACALVPWPFGSSVGKIELALEPPKEGRMGQKSAAIRRGEFAEQGTQQHLLVVTING